MSNYNAKSDTIQPSQVKGTKPKVKRWTFAELEADWKQWSAGVKDSDSKAALAFLGWICPRA